jgi:hypothetical protein
MIRLFHIYRLSGVPATTNNQMETMLKTQLRQESTACCIYWDHASITAIFPNEPRYSGPASISLYSLTDFTPNIYTRNLRAFRRLSNIHFFSKTN